MSNYSQKTYSCSHCSYHTTRKYNLERHCSLVHNIAYEEDPQNVQVGAPNVHVGAENVHVGAENVHVGAENVHVGAENVHVTPRIKCDLCYKTFTRKSSLTQHMISCKGVKNPLECPLCHKVLASRSSLSTHRKVCKGPCCEEEEPNITSTKNITNNITNNNTHNGNVNNINVTNIHVMNFPKGIEDQDFRFYKGHISEKRFKKLVTSCKPMTAFRNYAIELLSHEANHVAFKTSPNVKYSKVKREDGWEFEQDSEVIPVLTYHASCSALEDTHAAFENAKTNPQSKNFVQVLDDINTENDENSNFEDANDSVKFCVINTSLRSRLKP
jgi:hypothetical protein